VRSLARGVDGYDALLAAGDVHGRLKELAGKAVEIGDTPEERVAELLQDCANLDALVGAGGEGDRALLHLRAVGGADAMRVDELRDAYLHLFPKTYGFSAARVCGEESGGPFLLLEMPAVGRLITGEVGTHLIYARGAGVLPVQVVRVAMANDQDAAEAVAKHCRARQTWREAVATGAAAPDGDPHPLGPVVRVYDPESATLDLRTGLLCDGMPRGDDLRRFILAALPLPGALRVDVNAGRGEAGR
jgi:hypothetical protein